MSDSVPGPAVPLKDRVLESSASLVQGTSRNLRRDEQSFEPLKDVGAHLCAWHVYASNRSRNVEAHHYCAHLTRDVRQCLIYDSPERGARLIGIEYMITRQLYDKLPSDERKKWHSHKFEVKSGLLVMSGVPQLAESKEMEEVVGLYGKTWHLWQVDRGDELPVGDAQLMMSFTSEEQIDETMKAKIDDRDARLGTDTRAKEEARQYIEDVDIHPDADSVWP